MSTLALGAPRGSYLKGALLVLAAGTLWSFTGAIMRFAPHLDAWQFLFYRCLGIVVAHLVFSGRLGRASLGRRLAALGMAGAIAIVALTMASTGFIFAIRTTTVANALFFASCSPLLSALLGAILLKERLTPIVVAAIALGLDLDQFKAVNDTLGHPVGDGLLRQVADRLSHCLREEDTVARLGGDEFAIIQGLVAAADEASALAHRLIGLISAPYEVNGHQIVIGASIGIALSPSDSSEPDELLKKADMALYRAKADGRATFRYFEPEMDARLQSRRLLELDLRRALAVGEFEIHYQPIVDLRSEEVTACEALLRWHHPTRGVIPPLEFIQLAEEIGLIVPLGEWVLKRACAEANSWPGTTRVAVNLSPVQFRGNTLVQSVKAALALSKLPANRLELEITEAVLLQDNDETLSTLRELRALGVRIAMDDFGTGYSSLGYLRSFPFDRIKIDRSFVKDLETNPDCEAIIRAVTGLGGSLGIATTAEGVETTEQLARLRAEDCNEAQGYLISLPLPAANIMEFLRAGPVRRHKQTVGDQVALNAPVN